LFSGAVVAEAFSWSSATHQLFEADFNHDGYSDLLLQAKFAGQKHYFVAGQADARQRYDFTKHIELPQKMAHLKLTADWTADWTADKAAIAADQSAQPAKQPAAQKHRP